MPAPKRIVELVDKFRENYQYYQSDRYNEEQLRHEFLNPFFTELGWDMENVAGKGADRDVHYEERIKSGAPDFGFYLEGKLQFFVEAKNPTLRVCNDQSAALQLRTYGWSAKIARSILTDFEEFSYYDTAVRPKNTDQSRIARLDCIPYTEFVERWDEIAALFSREAVVQGSLQRLEKKRAKQAVDDELLEDISRWREALAKNIALRNEGLTEEQVNRAVQDTLDRIIFLRICEDRGIGREGKMQEIIEGDGVYAKLFKIFKKAEQRYDSGLFELNPVEAELHVDDRTISEIISELYFPKSPYKFDAIPAEILGQVYEQFLGKVIRLTAGHHAKVEEKPEVRKAGGVYYTPTYIVEYIVKNTVGRLVEGKKPKDIVKLSVLDPACGSGSFLIGAYQYLMDWYRDWYSMNDAKKNEKAKLIYRDGEGAWQLTLAERRRILVTHIYGVDIDRQAVEVAKLSLMLKALESPEQQSLFNDRILPDLVSNIKCGNSLIGTDYFAGQLTLDPTEMARVNPFDWDGNDGFPEIMKHGGFDVVIGNPPYISYSGRQAEELPEGIQRYFSSQYGAMKWPTAHSLFIERSVRKLSQRFVAFIVPDQIGHLEGYGTIRGIVTKNSGVLDVHYWGEHVFEDAVTPALTFVADKKYRGISKISLFGQDEVDITLVDGEAWRPIGKYQQFIQKLSLDSQTLGDIVADPGVHTGNCSEKLILIQPTSDSVPILEGKQVGRYSCASPKKYLRTNYVPEKDEYFSIRPNEKYRKARFVIRQTAAYPIVGPREGAIYFRNSLLALYEPKDGTDVRFIVGVLNSKLIKWLYRILVQEAHQQAFPQVKVKNLRVLPIKMLNLQAPKDVEMHDALVKLVDEIILLNLKNRETTSETERVALQRQIDATDQQIDRLVYKLYGLTEDEIRIVEEETRQK
ncbi:MAG: TaqI-like C-terminal specificity domain-containing protein [Patescibacteria group bacterium]